MRNSLGRIGRRCCAGRIEQLEDREFLELFPSDCWIFADVLEHLYDPWQVLRRIRSQLAESGQVIACIPNAQHWGVQARLNAGLFRYEDMGLMDRTHIRWFTRTTMIDLFQSTGFKIVEGMPRHAERSAIRSTPVRHHGDGQSDGCGSRGRRQ